ncbi:hypothetical protein A9Q83_16495 [Alphaproteobacteria bacterium 46_93_T64]|nr:hypothetical protein A9Q83_16495 [Alphaproteobacteria bacterium 46_93_T64]
MNDRSADKATTFKYRPIAELGDKESFATWNLYESFVRLSIFQFRSLLLALLSANCPNPPF